MDPVSTPPYLMLLKLQSLAFLIKDQFEILGPTIKKWDRDMKDPQNKTESFQHPP